MSPKDAPDPSSEDNVAPDRVLGFENLGSLLEGDEPDLDYLVEPILTTESLGAFVAAAKAGKTWVLCDVLVGVSTGVPVLGTFRVHRPGPVVAVFPEGGRRLIRRRIKAILESIGGYISDVRIVWVRPRGLPLGDRTAVAELRDAVKQTGAVLVVLDSIFLLLAGVRTSALNEVGAVLQELTNISTEFGCAILIGHHTNRQEQASGLYKATGAGVAEWASSFILATLGAKVTVGGTTTWTLRCELTARDLPELSFTSTFSVGAEDPADPASKLVYRVSTVVGEAANEDLEAQGLEWVDGRVLQAIRVLGPTGGNRRAINDVLAQTGKPLKHETLDAVLDRLLAAGLVDSLEGRWFATSDEGVR